MELGSHVTYASKCFLIATVAGMKTVSLGATLYSSTLRIELFPLLLEVSCVETSSRLSYLLNPIRRTRSLRSIFAFATPFAQTCFWSGVVSREISPMLSIAIGEQVLELMHEVPHKDPPPAVPIAPPSCLDKKSVMAQKPRGENMKILEYRTERDT